MVTAKPSGNRINDCAAAKRLIRLAGNVNTVEAAVRVLTERLLEDVQCPPTNLNAIFSRVNVTKCFGEDIWGSGELRREGKNLVIVYNSNHSVNRQRFSIAHELGHALLESTGRNCPRFGENVERICDMLATELLMPRSIFLSYIDEDVTVERIMKISGIFQTSIASTAIRFSELLDVSVFMTNESKISWTCGAIRKFHILADVKEYVNRATHGESGNEVVLLGEAVRRRQWQLEWIPLGQSKQALFLAKPIRSSRC